MKRVCADITSPYFYADSQQQKVWDVIREIFEAYQIGAFIDPYGVMQFLSLKSIVTNKTPNMVLHDSKTNDLVTIPGLAITSNIVQDTYTETVKAKIGKATIKYKIPQSSKTLAADGGHGFDNGPLSSNIIDKNDALWVMERDEMTTFNYLYEDISTVSQNYFKINPNDLLTVFNSFNVEHDGFAIIEGEILSFSDKEFKFSVIEGAGLTPDNIQTNYTAIVHDESDLKEAISEYSEKSGYGGAVSYTPTGKICNVERGLFNTPVRTHFVTDSISKFLLKMQSVSGAAHNLYDGAVFLDAPAYTNKTIYKPIGESSNSYNTFSTKIKMGPNSNLDQRAKVGGGLVMSIGNNPIYVEIREDITSVSLGNGITYKNKPIYELHVYKGEYSNSITSLISGDNYFVDITSMLENEVKLYPEDSPFEEFGKSINLKFVKTSSSTFEVYINKNKINIVPKSGVTIDIGGDFGIFAGSLGASSSSVPFTELYATQMVLDDSSTYYHYETPVFANTLAGNHKVMDMNYMYQIKPQIVGINYYDVRYSNAPALNAYPLKVSGNWWYYPDPKNNKTTLNKIDMREDALSYSDIYHSGFGGKIAIINSSPAAIWLKKAPDTTNPVDFMFSINTKNLIVLSDEFSISKIFDATNSSESIEIKTNWMQSKKSAIGVLNTIFKAIDGFSRDTQISVYGNPLYEIGDVVKVNYSLKNISNQTYFVQGVQQTFDSGLRTVLTLNQIG